ncbi:HYDIN, partial [Symbiodinium pilosum]
APPSNEFEIIPSRGTLLPNCAQRIQVDFISSTEKKYDTRLSVDLEGVGKELLSIPIFAQCAVPTVSFEPHGCLNYGDVFIRYPFHQSLYLHNTSVLPAKFMVEAQEDKSKAEFEPDQW